MGPLPSGSGFTSWPRTVSAFTSTWGKESSVPVNRTQIDQAPRTISFFPSLLPDLNHLWQMVLLAMVSLGNLPQCLATFSTGIPCGCGPSLLPRTALASGIHTPLSARHGTYWNRPSQECGYHKSDCSGPGSLATQPVNV